jgi:hypothetical protein
MSKSLGYTVPAPIEAKIHHLKEVKPSLKGTPMLGFLGNFSVNFAIPDYRGVGEPVLNMIQDRCQGGLER